MQNGNLDFNTMSADVAALNLICRNAMTVDFLAKDIVDREDLYSLLVGLCRPVYQFLQISEISYSKTFLTAERKYR